MSIVLTILLSIILPSTNRNCHFICSLYISFNRMEVNKPFPNHKFSCFVFWCKNELNWCWLENRHDPNTSVDNWMKPPCYQVEGNYCRELAILNTYEWMSSVIMSDVLCISFHHFWRDMFATELADFTLKGAEEPLTLLAQQCV